MLGVSVTEPRLGSSVRTASSVQTQTVPLLALSTPQAPCTLTIASTLLISSPECSATSSSAPPTAGFWFLDSTAKPPYQGSTTLLKMTLQFPRTPRLNRPPRRRDDSQPELRPCRRQRHRPRPRPRLQPDPRRQCLPSVMRSTAWRRSPTSCRSTSACLPSEWTNVAKQTGTKTAASLAPAAPWRRRFRRQHRQPKRRQHRRPHRRPHRRRSSPPCPRRPLRPPIPCNRIYEVQPCNARSDCSYALPRRQVPAQQPVPRRLRWSRGTRPHRRPPRPRPRNQLPRRPPRNISLDY